MATTEEIKISGYSGNRIFPFLEMKKGYYRDIDDVISALSQCCIQDKMYEYYLIEQRKVASVSFFTSDFLYSNWSFEALGIELDTFVGDNDEFLGIRKGYYRDINDVFSALEECCIIEDLVYIIQVKSEGLWASVFFEETDFSDDEDEEDEE